MGLFSACAVSAPAPSLRGLRARACAGRVHHGVTAGRSSATFGGGAGAASLGWTPRRAPRAGARRTGRRTAATLEEEPQFVTLQTQAAPARQPNYAELTADSRREGKDYTIEYMPNGYLLEEVAVSSPGARLENEPKWYTFRVKVGEVGKRKLDSFVLKSSLKDTNSQMLDVTLDRPLGIIFEPDTQGRVRVAELVPGFEAAQRYNVAKLNQTVSKEVCVGDILRACTATVVDYPFKASLVGDLTGTVRRVVLYGVDNQTWSKTAEALRLGLKADGDVTLILERPEPGSMYCSWNSVEEETPVDSEGNPVEVSSGPFDPMAAGLNGKNDQEAQDLGVAILVAILSLVTLIVGGMF